jgi:DNA-binding FadR family transcriptional regulator
LLTVEENDIHALTHAEGNLNQEVAQFIARKIISGTLPAGTSLQKEAALGQLLGVSRTVVREAVKVLVSKGLLSTRRKAGIEVNPRSHWHLFDPDILAWLFASPSEIHPELLIALTEVRLAFEPAVAKLVAQRADNALLSPIRNAFSNMQQADDKDSYYEADLAFHAALFEACPNDFFRQLQNVVMALLRRSFQLQSRSLIDKRYGLSLHKKVLEALERQDADQAEAVMRFLIYQARDELERVFKSVHPTS